MGKRSLRFSILLMVVGMVITILSATNIIVPKVEGFYLGLGIGFFITGVALIIKYILYKTNKEFKDEIDTEKVDERVKFIEEKSWKTTGKLGILISCIFEIVLGIMGKFEMLQGVGFVVCLLLSLYYFFYFYYNKKF